MTTTPQTPDPTRSPQPQQTQQTLQALQDTNPSIRLRAALATGTTPDPRYVDHLIERSATEPEFYVRDMLTWALTRHPAALTLPRLLQEVRSERTQARSQALHTLSKIADPHAWPAITPDLLTDTNDEVARSAWRAAVVLVPQDEETALAATLATQLGRGERETQLSLSQALVALGTPIEPILHEATNAQDPHVRAHALATRQLLHDPDAGFTLAIEEAKRTVALTGTPHDTQGTPHDGHSNTPYDGQGTPQDGQWTPC
ncbi:MULTISPECIES: HEAT repeat domain-containing protein [unclassified Streptomyces]|uniref:HEAT repeat domain-containing protein n=1 Tax=unclassified Streptomyces TaxID=2593676 RepID=UPI001EF15136|nr:MULTISPECIES: HEAT repeat domain-containing protein [unclassified Streptomyces]